MTAAIAALRAGRVAADLTGDSCHAGYHRGTVRREAPRGRGVAEAFDRLESGRMRFRGVFTPQDS